MNNGTKVISVKVFPRSKHRSLQQIDNHSYIARVIEAPEKGKANSAVISLLAKELNVKKSQIHLRTGMTSQYKQFEIS